MNITSRRGDLLVALMLFAVVTIDTPRAADDSGRRTLRLALYPFIPQKADFQFRLKDEFEGKNPKINLQFVDLPNYYDGQLWDTLTNSNPAVDVVEVDTVFLRDLVNGRLIQELPPTLFSSGEFLPVAQKACLVDNKTYGVPHWVCGNFLFYRLDDPENAKLKKVTSLDGLERLLGRPVSWSESLLLSLNGKSTLGEEYLDSVFDIYGTPDEALRHVDPKVPEVEAVRALNRLFQLTPGSICTSDKHHSYGQFFARAFAQRKARAFIGYSEELNNVVDEFLHAVPDGEPCVGKLNFIWSDAITNYIAEGAMDIGAIPAPFSDHPTHMLSWVDVLTLRQELSGQARSDALELIKFLNSEEFMLSLLVPHFGEAPRYLMPARASLFHNRKLLTAAPLYSTFFEIMTNTTALTAVNLNANLRKIGSDLQNAGFSSRR